jgi:hypothetical protein
VGCCGSDRIGSDRIGSDRIAPHWITSDRIGAHWVRSDHGQGKHIRCGIKRPAADTPQPCPPPIQLPPVPPQPALPPALPLPVICGTFGAVRFGAVRCGAVQCGAVRCSVAWCGVVQCGVVRCDVAWRGVVRCGSDWIGSDWIGSDRIGLDRTGSDRIAGAHWVRSDQGEGKHIRCGIKRPAADTPGGASCIAASCAGCRSSGYVRCTFDAWRACARAFERCCLFCRLMLRSASRLQLLVALSPTNTCTGSTTTCQSKVLPL